MIANSRRTRLVRPGQAEIDRLVGAGEGFSTLQFVLSGGMVGESHPISPSELPTAMMTTQAVADINYPNDVVIVCDADPRNTDNDLDVLGVPTDINALPSIFATQGPMWELNTIGAFPLNAPTQHSYDVAANFSVVCTQTASITVTPTRIYGGADNVQGLMCTAVVTTKPRRTDATRANLAGYASGHEHYRAGPINQPHHIVLAGNNELEYISGNSVDSPGTSFVSKSTLNIDNSEERQFVAYAGEGGAIPDYYSGPFTLAFDANIFLARESTIDQSVRSILIIEVHYANVDSSTGSLDISTVFKAFYGPNNPTPCIDGVANQWQGTYRFENPTNVGGSEGYASYLIGVVARVTAFNEIENQPHPINTGIIDFTTTFHSRSPSGDGPASITVVDGNYNGPIDIARTTTYYGLPNVDRQRDLRDSMAKPAPSVVADAVRMGLYCIFHASQGIVFIGQEELNSYLDLIEDPHRLLKVIAISTTNNDLLADNVGRVGVNPGLTSADDIALKDAGMEPVSLGASMAAARYKGAPKLKSALFDLLSKGLGALGGIAKGVTNVACSPGVSSLVDGLTRLGAARYGASGDEDDLMRAASRYRAAERGKGPTPKYEQSIVHVGMVPEVVERVKADTGKNTVEALDNMIPTVGGKPVTLLTPEDVIRRKKHARRKRYYSASFKREAFDGQEVECSSKRQKPTTDEKATRTATYHEFPKTDQGQRMPEEKTGEVEVLSSLEELRLAYRASSFNATAPPFQLLKVNVGITPHPSHSFSRAQVRFAAATAGSPARLLAPASGYEDAASAAGLPTTGKMRASEAGSEATRKLAQAFSLFEGDSDGGVETVQFDSEEEDEGDADTSTAGEEAVIEEPPEANLTLALPEPTYTGPTEKEFEKSMMAVTAGYFPNLRSTGAGPISSADSAKRRLNVSKDKIAVMLPACAHFPLVMDDEKGPTVHIATICVSAMPLARGSHAGDEKTQDILDVLENSYHPAFNVGNLRVKLDKAFEEKSKDFAMKAIKQAYARYPNTVKGPCYVSVDLGPVAIPNGAIEGDSFGLALFSAAMGLPCGPTLTGSIGDAGVLTAIGETNAKVNVFLKEEQLKDSPFSPLVFPRSSYPESAYQEQQQLKDSDLLANNGMFGAASNTGVVPIRCLNSFLAFFCLGGYQAWEDKHVSKDERSIMERFNRGWKAAAHVQHLTVKALKLQEERKAATGNAKDVITNQIRELKKVFDKTVGVAYSLKEPEVATITAGNALAQEQLADYAQERKKAMKMVTSDMDGGKYYFVEKSGRKTKQLGPHGTSKAQKKEWAKNNLKGVTKAVTIKQNSGKKVKVEVFIPDVVEGEKPKSKGKKASKDKAKELIRSKEGLDNLTKTLFG